MNEVSKDREALESPVTGQTATTRLCCDEPRDGASLLTVCGVHTTTHSEGQSTAQLGCPFQNASVRKGSKMAEKLLQVEGET